MTRHRRTAIGLLGAGNLLRGCKRSETHPESSRLVMHEVREFGEKHDLGLLVEPM